MTAKTSDPKPNKAQTTREQRLKQQLKANLARRKAGQPPKSEANPSKDEAAD